MDDISLIRQSGTVAHYSKLRHVADILHDRRLLLSSVANLADPREASLGWIDTEGIGHERAKENWLIAEQLKIKAGQNLRLLCTIDEPLTTSNPINGLEDTNFGRPRMWAQYGDQHQGFCLVLSKKELTERLLRSMKKEDLLIFDSFEYFKGLRIVGGGAIINYGAKIRPNESKLLEMINHNEMLKSVYFKKSPDWQGEQEYRWLLYSRRESPVFVDIEESLIAIVLGWKFPQNQVSQVKMYCEDLKCECYWLRYEHPEYKLEKL